jgi:hypothetical protein
MDKNRPETADSFFSIMKPGFWTPKWWVLLPAAMPVLAFLWLELGRILQLPMTRTPHLGAVAGQPAWIATGYYFVQHIIWIFLSPGGWLINELYGNGAAHSPGAFLLGIVFSIVFDCLIVYGTLLSARCGNPSWYFKK